MRIGTERLVLRPLDPVADVAALHRIGRDARVARMMMSIAPDWSLRQAAAFLEASRWHGRPGFRLAIALRAAPERMIGTVGIGGDPVSVAFFVDPAHWSLGYATEAMGAFLSVVLPRFGLSGVEADHFADNPASGAVLRKLGFVETGRAVGTSAAREAAGMSCRAISRAMPPRPVFWRSWALSRRGGGWFPALRWPRCGRMSIWC